MSEPTVLDDVDALDIVSGCLVLKVRHDCGTAHIYEVRLDEADLADADTVGQAARVLTRMALNFCHFGKIGVYSHTYYAMETNDTDENEIEWLDDDGRAPDIDIETTTLEDPEEPPPGP